MKPTRGPLATLLKGLEHSFRGLRQHLRDHRHRRAILQAFRRIDRCSLASRGRDLPRVSFLVLTDPSRPDETAGLERCLDSLRSQSLPVATVVPVPGRPLEGLRTALAAVVAGPVAVVLPTATFSDDATVWLGLALARSPGWKAVFADHVESDPAIGRGRPRPHIKPDFSWLYLLARHFVEPFVVYDHETLSAGVDRLIASGAEPTSAAEAAYAVAIESLRGLDARHVVHVREPLTHIGRRGSAGLHRVAEEALARQGVTACVTPHPADPRLHQVSLPGTAAARVSIIIPTKNAAGLVENCLTSLRANAGGTMFDVTVIDHDSDEPALAEYLGRETGAGRLSVLRWSGPFNYAASSVRLTHGLPVRTPCPARAYAR